MKFTFEPAPHYRAKQSTTGIMKDLTLCLLAVTVFSVIYYSAAYGANFGLRVVLLMVTAIVAGCAAEAIYFKMRKQDVKEGILTSYSWVTAMILVLISPINASYYGVAVSTILALVFGKLVFGGFGQNVFNPAALGQAILMSSFAATKSADFATGATPTAAIKGYGWLMTNEKFAEFVGQFGGLGKMAIGQYPSTIGSTCALLILICGIFLIVRKDIDWQAPVFYIGTIAVVSLIIGAMHGMGASYALFQVLAGGVMFGGIFMMTDPVTSPVTIPGRVIYGVGAACFTLILRLKSNMPDGVLYSILLMNMLTPAINKLMDGNQIKDAKKLATKVLIASVAFIAVTLGVGAVVEGKTPAPTASASTGSSEVVKLSDSFADQKATCEEVSNDGKVAVYSCSAEGFQGTNEATVTIDLGKMAVKSIEVTAFNDTPSIGDMATADDQLANYEGKTIDDEADITSSATFTSKSIAAMASAALNAAAGK